jgi:hypothetical protein
MNKMLVGVNDPKCGVYPQYDLFDKEMTFVMRGTSKELAKHVKSITVTPLSDYHVQRYLVRVRDFKNKSAMGFYVRTAKVKEVA